MAILIAICLPMLLILVAMFVGISQMQLARSEMRVAADAVARTATESILRTQDVDASYQEASSISLGHDVSKRNIRIERDDIVFGQGRSSVGGEWQFIPHQRPYNAAEVDITESLESGSGPIPFLLSITGLHHFQTSKSATASQVDHDIVLVVEAGGSMHAPQRWNGVMEAFEQLVQLVPTLGNKIRIGVVVCKKDPSMVLPLAEVSGDFTGEMERIHNDIKHTKLSEGRNLGGGIEMASNVLEAEKMFDYAADQTIVFLGNGHHTQGSHPVVAARLAASRHQVIYVFTFGHNTDKDGLMEKSAAVTGGKFFDVQDVSVLADILKDALINPSIVLIR